MRDAADQNQPLMCDSTASAQIRSLPIFETSTGVGTLPLRKPGILTDCREIVRRVLDGVLELVRRHVHRQADAILPELLHLAQSSGRHSSRLGMASRRGVDRRSGPSDGGPTLATWCSESSCSVPCSSSGSPLGTVTRRPLATASLVVAAFVAVLVVQTHEPLAGLAVFALIALVGLVADSVRETVGLLLGR